MTGSWVWPYILWLIKSMFASPWKLLESTTFTAHQPAPKGTLHVKVSWHLKSWMRRTECGASLWFSVFKAIPKPGPRTHTPMGPMPGPPPPWGMQKVLWRLRCETSDPKSPGRHIPTCHKGKDRKTSQELKRVLWRDSHPAPLRGEAGDVHRNVLRRSSTRYPTGSMPCSFYGNSIDHLDFKVWSEYTINS